MPMDDRTEVAVGILAESVPFVQAGGGGADWRVLITRRPPEGVLGGYWEFPGGKREHGESLELCLVREFQEEVGLSILVTDALPAMDHTYDHGRVRLRPFFCERCNPQQAPEALAVSEWRWVSPEELVDYTFPPANAPLLRHVLHALRRAPRQVTGAPVIEPGPAS